MKTGKQLKLLRIEKDIQAKMIAQHLNISKSYISLMEKGCRPIPQEVYYKWINLLEN